MTGHTKEPWVVIGTEIVCASDESHIAEVPHGGSPEQDAADRARIVDCVNALASIPDPAAYVAAFDGMVGALGIALPLLASRAFPKTVDALNTALTAARLARGGE